MADDHVLFRPLRGERAFEAVSTEIKKLIVSGSLRPGDRLSSEGELARQFGVGRTTVREALRLLEMSGFLKIQTGARGGPIVTNTIMNALHDSLLNAVHMRNVSVADLTEARVEIETMVLPHAVSSATETDLQLLAENVSSTSAALQRGVQDFDKSINFHTLIAKASRNSVFVIVQEAIQTIVADFLTSVPQPIDVSRRVASEHEAIFKAIEARDSSKAVELMERHLRGINDQFRESFERLADEGLL